MKTFEISGNLTDEDGLGKDYYSTFVKIICNVRNYFIKYLGNSFMSSLDLYTDNVTNYEAKCKYNTANNCVSRSHSGQPNITPVLGKYLIIKLNISQNDEEARIAFQFSHELMHYVYFVKYGLCKESPNNDEESICTAASLIVIRDLFRNDFDRYNNHTKSLINEGYRKGAEIAEKVNYKFEELLKIIKSS